MPFLKKHPHPINRKQEEVKKISVKYVKMILRGITAGFQ